MRACRLYRLHVWRSVVSQRAVGGRPNLNELIVVLQGI